MEKKFIADTDMKLRPYKAIDGNAIAGWIRDEKVEIHFGYERKEDGYEGII